MKTQKRKSIEKRLDEYIEFAKARNCFSDLEFYKDIKFSLILNDNIDLTLGTNTRYNKQHVEFYAKCGCAYHPIPKPHIHQCNGHKDK